VVLQKLLVCCRIKCSVVNHVNYASRFEPMLKPVSNLKEGKSVDFHFVPSVRRANP
jgi:hypothetical protein